MSKDSKSPLWKRAIDRAIGPESADQPLATRLLKKLPGGEYAQGQIDRIEQRVLQELKQRLDRLERTAAEVSVVAFSVEPAAPTAAQRERAAGEMMRKLLETSVEQTRKDAQAAYYAALVSRLLPDEARILSALSDGTRFPLIQILSAPKMGLSTTNVLDNLSTVGRSAGVQWPDMTHGYVQRLLAAGLGEVGPEDPALAARYELLEADDLVRRTQEQIRKAGHRSLIRRKTLHISELGSNLWEACRITED